VYKTLDDDVLSCVGRGLCDGLPSVLIRSRNLRCEAANVLTKDCRASDDGDDWPFLSARYFANSTSYHNIQV
jgi:hypothetical protein